MIKTLTVNSLTLGTLASGYLFEKLAGFAYPDIKVDVKDRGSYHGARLGKYTYGRRIMRIDGMILGDDQSDYESKRRALAQAVVLIKGLQTITFTTRSGLVVTAQAILNNELTEPYKKGDMVLGKFRLELVAPDPFFYGTTTISTDITPYTGGGGAVPSAIPFSLGTGGTGLTTITNSGNGFAYPTIKIYGSIENPSMQNTTTGEQFSISYTLSSSTDYIEIDTWNRTVLYNGVTNIRNKFSGDWLTLAPGDNELKLTSASYTPSAKATVAFKDTYLGI